MTRFAVMLGWIACVSSAWATSLLPVTVDEQAEQAAAVCRGTVLQDECFRDLRDGLIYTRTLVRVEEALKGDLPEVIELVHPGGMLDGEGQSFGLSPQLRPGMERWFFLAQRSDGTFYTMLGDASVKPVANEPGQLFDVLAIPPSNVPGLLPATNGIPCRFTASDRGEPIPYVIDATTLPAGINITQATNAVANAFKAWADATTLRFAFDGLQDFGMAASGLTNRDGRIYLQLHNTHGAITNGNVLGINGRAFRFNDALFPGGGLGGRGGSNEFHLTTFSFVVLSHTNASMQTLSTFEEVLGHEIGHALSMAHSSEDENESDDTLRQALMFFQVHADARGAALGTYDVPVIHQSYPATNAPPYGYDRVIYAVTMSAGQVLANPEVNQVEMTGYDLRGDALTRSMTNQTAGAGTFSFNGDKVVFAPSNLFAGAPVDPAGSSFFDRAYVRLDDGTNASPFVLVRVVALLADTRPMGAPDGLPNDWMTTHFSSITPVAGLSQPGDDPDGERRTNLGEFLGGMNPRDGNSDVRVFAYDGNTLSWLSRPFDLFEVQSASALTNWTRWGNPVVATTNTTSRTGLTNQFLRVRRVP